MQLGGGAAAFSLIYFTFFLDNVLLTVLVPILPEWLGARDAVWTNTTLSNHTTQLNEDELEVSPLVAGVVLGMKAGAQLLVAPLSAAAVTARGPAPVLRSATLTLAVAALALRACGALAGGARCAWCVGGARALHGAGAGGAGVAGLALAARALPVPQRDRGIGVLLGAVALGVLVGYPVGGAATALWPRGAPFMLLASALLVDLALQYAFLDAEEYNKPEEGSEWGAGGAAAGWRRVWSVAGRGAAGACAGAVLLTTAVMAALEPCLPPWLARTFHLRRWVVGAAFLPDSAAYLVAASALGGAARMLGAERVALAGQASVALAALRLPAARSVWALALPHAALGAGLGATDAALVPALIARHPNDAPALAALLQAAASAAYALGPALGGAAAQALGFSATLRALGVANLLYLALLYRTLKKYPLSPQWGATTPDDEEDQSAAEVTPLHAGTYKPLQ